MKIIVTVFIVIGLSLASVSIAAAQTMDVDVNPGVAVAVEKDFLGNDNWRLIGNLGLNDQFLLKLAYESNIDAFTLGGRFELMPGRAVVFDYSIYGDNNIFDIALRDRLDLAESLELVGELKLLNSRITVAGVTDSTITWTYTLELQQKFNEQWTGNLDLAYNYTHGETDILGAFGADYHADGYKLYFNYRIYPNNDDNTLTTGLEIGL